jgi:hypothetical protein
MELSLWELENRSSEEIEALKNEVVCYREKN